jgi:tetratricopeptide (TPR) repeat protein
VHRASGHPIAAIQDYTTALALSPDLPRALRGRAQAYVDDKRYGPALADLQRLLEVEPDQPIIHADIGLALMQAGKFADALKSFNTAARQGVREPRLYLNRGLALFSLGGVGTASRALDDIERALALDPGYALAYFNRALIFEQAARAGVRLRDAASPEIMRLVAAQNIARACQLGHVPACDVERMRAEEKARSMPGGEGPSVLTPEMLRDRGLAVPGP